MFAWLCVVFLCAVQHNIHIVHNVYNDDNGSSDDAHVDDSAHTHDDAVRVPAQQAGCAEGSTGEGCGLLPGGEIHADQPLVRILVFAHILRSIHIGDLLIVNYCVNFSVT